jgi:hypothetical protein
MIRQSLLALAAVAVLGTGALTPNTAAAAWRGWHRDAIEDRFERRDRFEDRREHRDRVEDRFERRDRFEDRFDRRFFFVRHPFAFRRFAFVGGDGCVSIRRAWTPWGWSWQRIWVCG